MHRTSLKAAAAAGFICRSRTMAAILYQRQPFVLARHRVNTLTNLTLFEVTNVNVWISPLVKKGWAIGRSLGNFFKKKNMLDVTNENGHYNHHYATQ